MPELPELRIMSDFINEKSLDINFKKAYNVEKGNIPFVMLDSDFSIKSYTNGKELILDITTSYNSFPIYVFMGMNGNWKFVSTEDWNETKFVRMKFDSDNGDSLILFGGFMGPKYSVGKPFNGVKRGPDPTKNFLEFKENVYRNLSNKAFDSPIYEVLLNQSYFNGIGNYLRSTILYYLDINPFLIGREVIKSNPKILELCRDIPLESYRLNGGQLKDWSNPFDYDSKEFEKWVYYQKGLSLKDSNNRTFWYDPKWDYLKNITS